MNKLEKSYPFESYVIKSLEESKIISVIDFLNTDIDKLVKTSSLPLRKVLEIKEKLAKDFPFPSFDGLGFYHEFSVKKSLPTFIKSLDILLKGGLDSLTEICGLSGAGKTQLCMSLALNIAMNLKQPVLYIDTKGDFSATFLNSILENQGKNSKECDEILEMIDVIFIKNIYEMMSQLESLQEDLKHNNFPSYQLIIIDSVTVLYFPFLSKTGKVSGQSLLNYIASLLKSISYLFKIPILIANLGTKYQDGIEGADNEEGENDNGELKPLLGKYWSHVPNTRLGILKMSDLNKQRTIQVIKSSSLPLGSSCIVKLSYFGVE